MSECGGVRKRAEWWRNNKQVARDEKELRWRGGRGSYGGGSYGGRGGGSYGGRGGGSYGWKLLGGVMGGSYWGEL